MIDELIIKFANDTENAELNYLLGLEYDKIGQTAAAISYFLRASERTTDKLKQYECLIRIGKCFDKQRNRNYTVRSMYQSAICVLPERPEAYYLMSRLYESEGNHFESYLMMEIAINNTKEYESINVGYHGRWCLFFQKAVAAWWRGRGMESREIFQKLLNHHWDEMDQEHKNNTEKNIVNLGSGPYDHAFRMYDSSMYEKLRYKFPGSEKLKKNFSQVYQDLFILSVLDGKRNGTFLEIGGADPYLGNNTYLLEKEYDWYGVSLEFNEKFIDKYKKERPRTDIRCVDALTVDYEKLIKEKFNSNVIDYLQLDIEPAKNTYECMLKIPFDSVKFRVITYEHDYYADITRSYKQKSRDFLKSKGYILVANDISPDGICTFEDWWVHPDFIDPKILKIMTDVSDKVKAIEKYMLISDAKDNGKLSGLPTIHCVSLEESVDRRANLEKWLNTYNITDYVPHIFKRFEEYNHTLVGNLVESLSEHSKGPVTSHLCLLKELYEKYDDEYFFIAEDDLSLEPVQYWNFTWKEFVNKLPDDWKCVQLSVIREYRCNHYHFNRRYCGDWLAASYIIKREHIKYLLDKHYSSDTFTLDLDVNIIPVVEQVLFPSYLPGIYTVPLFAEDCYNTVSTLSGILTLENNQGHFHHDSYDDVINWWKNTGQNVNLEDIMRGTVEHIYHEPQFGENWFSYPNLYIQMVKKFPTGSKFVEIGSWKGKSSAFMAVQIANSYKKIDFHCVDTWQGSIEHQGRDDLDHLYDIFTNNMKPLENYYTAIRTTSLDGANRFEDDSLDFVFIDASHEYEDVKKDIAAWLPKVKVGGVIAGHDYYLGDNDYFPGVKQAVHESFETDELSFEEDCWIHEVKEKKTMNFYNINSRAIRTSWVVDSFYSDPDRVRKFALEQEYLEGGLGKGFIGRRTHQQFLFPGLKEKFQDIMGMKVTNWESHGMNGRFQVAWSGEPLVYHCDSQKWGGMLYLSPGAPFQCGTTLYANKKTRARTYYDQGWDVAWKDVPGDPHLDGTPFEPVDVLGNVYNRLVIFDASCIHSASQYFGTVSTNSRLWQMFFFDTE
jgi:tetratricopeptide (TPR) repeat protein